ncbi:hypothetical protein BJ170DRAFT_282957 [Xylariales sp. AK1849]|nr:hypothetical protein BJ170DRAFT_282957 [Xylariales sp. AK1849]
MQEVYSNSFLNISADTSKNGGEGLFRKRNPFSVRSVLVQTSSSTPDMSQRYLCYHDGWHRGIWMAPVNDRAWVVQERFLAPRVVHFSFDQVHWECSSFMTSEGLPDSFHIAHDSYGKLKRMNFRPLTEERHDSDFESFYENWDGLVKVYSYGGLTHMSDKSIAFSGLARAFHRYLHLAPADYLCGLWRPRFIEGLMWMNMGDTETLHLSTPSWSWLSVDKGVWFSTEANDRWTNIATLIEVATEPRAEPFGPIRPGSGFARLRVPLCSAIVSKLESHYFNNRTRWRFRLHLGEATINQSKCFDLRWDDVTDAAIDRVLQSKIYLMLGRSRRMESGASEPERMQQGETSSLIEPRFNNIDYMDKEKDDSPPWYYGGNYHCLILVPETGAQQCQYRRVGYISFDGKISQPAHVILDKCFRSHDIPEHLYEKVDGDFMYTITLI